VSVGALPVPGFFVPPDQNPDNILGILTDPYKAFLPF
jgi:hypothetical protein